MDWLNFIPLLVWSLAFAPTASLSCYLDRKNNPEPKPIKEIELESMAKFYLFGIVGFFILGCLLSL
jgi:hypothetical protein